MYHVLSAVCMCDHISDLTEMAERQEGEEGTGLLGSDWGRVSESVWVFRWHIGVDGHARAALPFHTRPTSCLVVPPRWEARRSMDRWRGRPERLEREERGWEQR